MCIHAVRVRAIDPDAVAAAAVDPDAVVAGAVQVDAVVLRAVQAGPVEPDVVELGAVDVDAVRDDVGMRGSRGGERQDGRRSEGLGQHGGAPLWACDRNVAGLARWSAEAPVGFGTVTCPTK